MKILIFMSGFFPGKKYGGPPISVDNFCNLMKNDDVYIVTSDHDLGESNRYSEINDGWNDRGNCKVLYLSDKNYNISSAKNIVSQIKPDVLYLQSLFSKQTLFGLICSKKYGIKTLLAPRGELNQGAFKKKYKKIPYIKFLKLSGLLKNVSLQVTSDSERLSSEKILKIPRERIYKVENVPTIPNKVYVHEKKISGTGKFIFLSRIHPKKNLIGALDYLKNVSGDVIFDIYGPIEDKQYREKCEEKIKDFPKNIKVKYCGIIDHNDIHETFSKYDSFLFPTFSENYGHVIAESLLAGTPVIISDQTPWTDINSTKAGWAIPLYDREKFVECIELIINQNEFDSIVQKKYINSYLQKKINLKEIKVAYLKALK